MRESIEYSSEFDLVTQEKTMRIREGWGDGGMVKASAANEQMLDEIEAALERHASPPKRRVPPAFQFPTDRSAYGVVRPPAGGRRRSPTTMRQE